MNYISNYKDYVYERLTHRKLKNPHVIDIEAIASSPKPIPGGVVLIISNPLFNGKRRIYMGIIDKVLTDKLPNVYGGLLTGEFYILKEHPGGIIMPEKIMRLDYEKRMLILNMNSNGIYFNDNKTPFWNTSSNSNKLKFFTSNQPILHELKNINNVEIPQTYMKTKVNLH